MTTDAGKGDGHMDKPRRTTRVVHSPIGPLTLTAENDALVEIDFATSAGTAEGKVGSPEGSASATGEDDAGPRPVSATDRVLDEAARQLDGYFAGERRRFDLPLDPHGTAFQTDVWEALRKIPYGETRSYADIARRIGRPTAVRAVGRANGQNPLAIVVPCHRVIGADGSLTGYSGGVDKKRTLLELESRVLEARGGD
jgi:methylated-DNA-[protein]-cysteine S-methyltransferase